MRKYMLSVLEEACKRHARALDTCEDNVPDGPEPAPTDPRQRCKH